MADDVQEVEQPDVVVQVEAETPPAEVVVKDDKAVVKDPAINDLVQQYKDLEAKEKASNEAKADAERRARDAQVEADNAKREAAAARQAATNSNLDTITTALTAAQEAADAAQRDIELAISNQDAKAQADAQRRLARAEALVLRYDESKSDLEARAKVKPAEPTRPSDPVEAYAQGRAPQTANWLRSHRDYVTDQRKNHKLQAAHSNALSEGIEPDTDAYFEAVETFLGLRKVEKTVDPPEVTEGDNVQRPSVAAAAKKPAARAVAPVGSSRANGGTVSGNEVRLSAGEAQAATDGTHVWGAHDLASGRIKDKSMIGSPIGHQEMARRKLAMQRNGQYDRAYLEQ